ncbi:MAG: transcriptional regulator, partial [Tepidisphaerales bacterium]
LAGVSTQIQNVVADWDELIAASDGDYGASGLKKPSAIRLSFLYAADRSELVGVIGSIDSARFRRLRERLSRHLAAP